MENTLQITPELYEQIKQEVIAEQRAKAQARAEERKRKAEAEREEHARIDLQLLPLKAKYVPLFAKRYEKTFFSGNKPLYQVIEVKIQEALTVALHMLRLSTVREAYRIGRLDEVIATTYKVLDSTFEGYAENNKSASETTQK